MNIKELQEEINDIIDKIYASGIEPENVNVEIEMANLRSNGISIKINDSYKFTRGIILCSGNIKVLGETQRIDLEKRVKGLEEALAQLQFRLIFAGETQPNQTYGPFPEIEKCKPSEEK